MAQQEEAQTIGAIKALLDWTFQVEIPDQVMGWVTEQLRWSWNDGDPSEQQLVAYLVELATHLAGMDDAKLRELHPQVVDVLQKVFAEVQLNDRGRALVFFRGILETLRPGCTHLPQALAATTGQPAGGPSISIGSRATSASAQPSYAPVGGGASHGAPQAGGQAGPAPSVPGVNDILAQQMEMQRQAQAIAMQSNMQKMFHDLNMQIIGNIR